MRLISQNKRVDIPYEHFILSLAVSVGSNEYLIRASSIFNKTNFIDMAKYSTREQAEKEILEPAVLLQRWNITSFTMTCPEPKVYMFEPDQKV